ncbi:hypothetical protein [Bacillus altitudinis]|uniref:hypothetical protein n=1 Tax=Bacillus altitudinis TaxID=293387 RepID=UPI0022362350|nr:hypothetical protein [Bacillus altitudinis]
MLKIGECDGQIVLAEITQRTDGNYDEGTIWYIGRNVPYADLETLAEVVTHLLKLGSLNRFEDVRTEEGCFLCPI